MSLEAEVEDRSREISTDSYTMSIGELISMYKDGDLEIHPEFQRYFRWSDDQKSRFVESLLLGIPVPSVFVSQRSDGVWELVDGLQRVSTILQLSGELQNEKGETEPELNLGGTRYLPQLEGVTWSGGIDSKELPESLKRKIKRARLDIRIVLNTSDRAAKYELFDRLNTGGSVATAQEVRNCLLIMVNETFFNWLSDLSKFDAFVDCTPLSDRQKEEAFDLELVTRFVALRTMKFEEIRKFRDISPFLTSKIMEMAEQKKFGYERERKAFETVFRTLSAVFGEDAFRKFDKVKNRYSGALSLSVFEAIALGLGYWADEPKFQNRVGNLQAVQQGLWDDEGFKAFARSGVSAAQRLPFAVQYGRKLFEE